MSSELTEPPAASEAPNSASRSWSISSRFVWLFTASATLLLVCVMGLLYWILLRHIFQENNAALVDKIALLRGELSEEAGPDALNLELEMARAGQDGAYWVRVRNASGHLFAQTPKMDEVLPATLFPPERPASAPIEPANYQSADGRFFSLIAVAEEIKGLRYAIQIARDQSNDQHFTERFGILLLAVLAGGVIASAAIAIGVTKQGLRPLHEMAEAIEGVGARRLHERLPATGWPNELRPLAAAFNMMLARLEDSFIRLSQFSADLAHEFRTPIASMRGEAEVALMKTRTPDEYQNMIGSSVEEYGRLSALIDNLLFLARAETADAPIERSSFDARAVVEELRDFYETLGEERTVRIRCQGDCAVYAERILFRRAVGNLLANAVRFSPEGGTVLVSIVARREACEITIADSGPGIAREHLPRIFDRFYRIDSSRNTQGTGLGLALVQSIMKVHQGTAFIGSEVGRGTTVTLAFPHPASARKTQPAVTNDSLGS